MSLENIQNEFIDYLYTLKPGSEQQEHIRSYFLHPQYPDPHNGLKVYKGNLVFGLLGAMKETYVFSKVLLGENNFNFFGREFLFQNPSKNSDLIQYGGGFGEFLATRSEIAHIAFIADVAKLEWALERAFYAKPEPSFMGQIPAGGEMGSPTLKQSVQLITTRYRVHEAWLAFTEHGEEGIRAEMFKPEPEYLVIWSDEGSPRVTPINEVLGQWVNNTLLGQNPAQIMASTNLTKENLLEAHQFALRQGWISQK
jgi:Putative DNA-binding domain